MRYSAQFFVNESVANPCQALVRFGLGWLELSMGVSIAFIQNYVNTQKQRKLRRTNADETIRGKYTKQICPERSETRD